MKSKPTIYVANGKLSHEVLQYRCPRTNQLRSLRIGAGRQEQIGGDYNVDELHQIVKQIEIYHDEVPTVEAMKNVRSTRGLIFCLDKPIASDVIQERMEKEKDLAQETASQEAENAGVAAFVAAKKGGGVQETSLEVIQLDDDRQNASRDAKAVDFEVSVSKRTRGRTESRRKKV